MKILLVEDDKQTADYIAKGLREHGHVVDHADNGRDGRPDAQEGGGKAGGKAGGVGSGGALAGCC